LYGDKLYHTADLSYTGGLFLRIQNSKYTMGRKQIVFFIYNNKFTLEKEECVTQAEAELVKYACSLQYPFKPSIVNLVNVAI
jgi:hypothetical protein